MMKQQKSNRADGTWGRSTGKNEKYSDPRPFHTGFEITTFWWRTPQNCVQTQIHG